MRRLYLSAAAAIVANAFGAAAASGASHASPNVNAMRAAVAAFMKEQNVPGATVAVSVGGRTIWNEGFGLSDVEDGAAATTHSMYRTASMGKPMAATLAFMLSKDGKLDFKAPVQRYCPRYPAGRWTISVEDLIAHSSGIREPNDDDELYNTRHYDHPSDAVALFAHDPLRFEPGTDFGYTTWGYVLLGCVLEGASGKPLPALFDQRIFKPAHMARTRPDDPREIVSGRSRGYALTGGRLTVAPWTDMSHKLAAGGWITDTHDMLGFMNAWMSGKFLDSADRTRMITPYRLRNGSTVDNFGMGWFTDTYRATRFAFHGGGTPGVSAIELMVPSRRVAVIAFFNRQDIGGDPRISLARKLAEIAGAF